MWRDLWNILTLPIKDVGYLLVAVWGLMRLGLPSPDKWCDFHMTTHQINHRCFRARTLWCHDCAAWRNVGQHFVCSSDPRHTLDPWMVLGHPFGNSAIPVHRWGGETPLRPQVRPQEPPDAP